MTRGNLSVRSLADIVKKEHFIGDSEYMDTVLVAVPKCVSSLHPGGSRVLSSLMASCQELCQGLEHQVRAVDTDGGTPLIDVHCV